MVIRAIWIKISAISSLFVQLANLDSKAFTSSQLTPRIITMSEKIVSISSLEMISIASSSIVGFLSGSINNYECGCYELPQ